MFTRRFVSAIACLSNDEILVASESTKEPVRRQETRDSRGDRT